MEYQLVKYRPQSFNLWSIFPRVSSCEVSALEYQPLEYPPQGISLQCIDHRVSVCGVLTSEYQAVEYQPSERDMFLAIETYTENSRIEDRVKIWYEQRHWRIGAKHER